MAHEGGGGPVAMNAAGFRSDREFHTERSSGKRRIPVFGDSFTAGTESPTNTVREFLEIPWFRHECNKTGLSEAGW